MFNSLSRENIHEIIDIELIGLYNRVKIMGYELKISAQAKDFIADKGFDVQFGARPLKRSIQKYLEDPMAEFMLAGGLDAGDTIQIDYDKVVDEITLKALKPEN